MTSHVAHSWRKTATLVASLVAASSLLSACSLFSGPWTRDGEERKPEKAEKKLTGLPPIATHRFEYDPAKDDVVGVMQKTIVGEDDTLPDIARRFNLGYEEIVRANPGVDPWLPGAGREVVLPTRFILPSAPHEGVVINIPAMRLFYFPKRKENEPHVVVTYPIGIGKVGWATPEGTTKILRRTKDPTWTVPVSVREEHRKNGEELPPIVPPGPDNPLGRHSFTLGWPSYLVHGTNKPYGVGMRSSHGCIRLYPEDIEQLFDTVPIGTKLRVVNQPYLLGRIGDDLLLQAYDVLEDDKRDWEKSHRKLFEKSLSAAVKKTLKDGKIALDWERFETLVRDPRGIPVSMLLPQASLDTEIVGARLVQNTVPDGSNWDGQIVIDEEKFQELLSDRDPGETGTSGNPGSPAPPAQQSAPEGGSQ
jgi:L,D-transpeptidase ErfK/SrfK